MLKRKYFRGKLEEKSVRQKKYVMQVIMMIFI